jgi:hypothetical protein
LASSQLWLTVFPEYKVVVLTIIQSNPADLILAASDPLIAIRIVAGVALVAVIVAFVHVLRHLKQIEQTIVKDDLVPTERGPRNNVLLMVCAIPIVVVALLLFLIIKA